MGRDAENFRGFQIDSEFFPTKKRNFGEFGENKFETNPRNSGKMSVLTVCSLSGILSNYPESLPGEKYQIQILLHKTKSKSSGSRILTLFLSSACLRPLKRLVESSRPKDINTNPTLAMAPHRAASSARSSFHAALFCWSRQSKGKLDLCARRTHHKPRFLRRNAWFWSCDYGATP